RAGSLRGRDSCRATRRILFFMVSGWLARAPSGVGPATGPAIVREHGLWAASSRRMTRRPPSGSLPEPLRQVYGRIMRFVDADGRPGEAVTPPWFARLSGRPGHPAVPDPIDYAIAAGCFVAFTGPALVVPDLRIGSPLAVAGLGALAAAPLIVRRKWPVATLAAVAVVYVAATLTGGRVPPFVRHRRPHFSTAVFYSSCTCRRRPRQPRPVR